MLINRALRLNYGFRLIAILFATVVGTSCDLADKNDFFPTNLRVENIRNPIAVDVTAPHLSWNMESDKRGQHQSAYHILVSGSIENLDKNIGEYWDSDKVESDISCNIKYAGQRLTSREMLYWKVKVWNAAGEVSPWSEPAKWEMSFLQQADWKAKWIGIAEDKDPYSAKTYPAPYFRKEIEIVHKIKAAKVYVSGLGYYELYLNGRKVGDHVLAPAQTNYDKRALPKLLYHYDDQSSTRVLYNTFDVTDQLKTGQNAIGMILGNGWYNQRDRVVEGDLWYASPRLICQLEIEYTNGEKELVKSDKDWKVKTGPILHDGIFTGEIYDARLEQEEWNLPEFDDSAWESAEVVRAPTGKTVSQLAPPDRVIRTFKPVKISRNEDGLTVVDAGEMISGWVRLRINEKSGQEISMRFFEELGSSYGQQDVYISKGITDIYEPRFTWHAFRTVEISGLTKPITLEDIDIVVVNTDVSPTGSFRCSNELFNQIQENYLRTQLGNFHGSISSDCPHRERLGYLGDGSVLAESSVYNFDMTNFYQKWVNDMDDARNKKTGFVPHTAPYEGGGGGPAWGSAYVIIPWHYYLYYGDSRILEEHYSGMKQWVAYLGTRTDQNGIVVREEPNGWCLGDWATPAKIEIPPAFVNTCYYFYVAKLMKKTALVLGNEADAAYYNALAKEIKDVINKHFFDSKSNQYWEGRQGANVFALAFGIVPKDRIKEVLENLKANIHSNKGHFDTGILATPLALDVLTTYGLEDLAYTMMNQRDFPGFGDYILGKGATALWENWNGASSHSHPMFGSVSKWFYQAVAGIYPDEEKPGFKNVIIKPAMCGNLTYASADYRSQYGKISVNYKIINDDLHLDIEIPANSTGTVYIPAENPEKITERGKNIYKAKGIEFVKLENEKAVIKVCSGNYSFISKDIGALIQAEMPALTPVISPSQNLFLKPDTARITIESGTDGAEIYYTTDGSDPNEKSKLYDSPILLNDNSVIKAIAVKKGLFKSYVKTKKIEFVSPETNGINYTVYEGEWSDKPDTTKLRKVSQGRQFDFDVNKINKREDYIAIVFDGFIQIDQAGLYTFFSSANDGCWLYVNNELIIESLSGSDSGQIRLAPGKYPFKIVYFENEGTESLEVALKRPDAEKEQIPPGMLLVE